MSAKIDVFTLILGVLLSIVGAGIYEFLFYILQGPNKVVEVQSAFWATILTSVIFVGYAMFFFISVKKKEKDKDSRTSKRSTLIAEPKELIRIEKRRLE